MIKSLPKWVEVGALSLAFVASFVNLIGIVGFEHQAVSHVTGSVTQLSYSLSELAWDKSIFLVFVLVSFLLGSVLSGVLLHGTTLRKGHRYDIALLIEAILLFLSIWFLINGMVFGLMLTAFACGLQNALATTFSGAIIRTTHLTGVFTDLGIALGNVIRGEELDSRKIKLFLLKIIGFALGGIFGSVLYSEVQFYSLILPALICLLFAFVYRIIG